MEEIKKMTAYDLEVLWPDLGLMLKINELIYKITKLERRIVELERVGK